jgi:hypothetical protein
MSFRQIDQLTQDSIFAGRIRACATQQAETFKDDQRADWVAVANDVLRNGPNCAGAFTRLTAAGPGIADIAATPDDGIDQSRVTDADILSSVQANWGVVASLYFTSDGTPIEGA